MMSPFHRRRLRRGAAVVYPKFLPCLRYQLTIGRLRKRLSRGVR